MANQREHAVTVASMAIMKANAETKKKQDEENAYIACEQHEVVFNCAEETSMKCVECYGKDNDISVATNTWIANSSASE